MYTAKELLQAVDGNPCVKTGCCARIGNKYYVGDLFDLGQYYMLNCSAPGQSVTHATRLQVHLLSYTWWSTHQADKVVILEKEKCEWVVYDAQFYPTEARSC